MTVDEDDEREEDEEDEEGKDEGDATGTEGGRLSAGASQVVRC